MQNDYACQFAREWRGIACVGLLALISTAVSATFAAGSGVDGSRSVAERLASVDDSAQDRREISPDGEEFTISFPDPPWLTVGKRFFGDRQRNYEFHFYTVFSGDVLYIVESYEGDRPKELASMALVRHGLSSGADVDLNGYQGKEFIQEKEGLLVKGRYFATKKHLYIVEAATRGSSAPAIDEFLNSFRLEQQGSTLPATALSRPPAVDSSDEVFKAQEVSTKAVLLSKMPASYTNRARDQKINGTVVLEAVLRSTGVVGDIEVRSGLPGGLTEQSIAATKAIIFVPAIKDGKPVSQRIMVEYNFNIY
jgi:hypothetical protein